MIFNILELEKIFNDYNFDLLILSTKENIKYISGFNPVIKTLNPYYGECYILIHRSIPNYISIVHSLGEVDQVLDALVPIKYIETYGKFYREYNNKTLDSEEIELMNLSNISFSNETAYNALLNIILKLNGFGEINNIAFDEDAFPSKSLNLLKSHYKNKKFYELSNIFRKIRSKKTEYEITQIQKSARINEASILETTKNLYLGISEEEISNIFNQNLVKLGAIPSLTMLKLGRAAVGGQRKQKQNIKLGVGDIVWFDSDAIYEGYWSDIARVYVVGQHDEELSFKYNALRNGMLEGFEYIRPGRTGSEIFNHIITVIHKSGFKDYRRHHVGHGIGLEPYELPILSPLDNNYIEEGMVISLETPYYEFGFGALHIEDPIYVENKGNRFLTSNPVPENIILEL